MKDVTLSGLLCSSGLVNEIQPRSFYLQDKFLNAPILCKNVDHLRLKEMHYIKTNQQSTKKKTGRLTDVLQSSISEEELDFVLKAAKERLIERRKKEYELWLISKLKKCSSYYKK